MIRAGLLRTPIVILGSTPYVDNLGGEAYSFTPKFKTKAQVIYNANDKEEIND
jgi:SPP1 family predicted phage head-tail adaptor